MIIAQRYYVNCETAGENARKVRYSLTLEIHTLFLLYRVRLNDVHSLLLKIGCI